MKPASAPRKSDRWRCTRAKYDQGTSDEQQEALRRVQGLERKGNAGMTRDEKIMKIALEYGYEAQSRQCIEEMAELIQAINKLWRVSRKVGDCALKFYDRDSDIVRAREHIVEELADVQIMVWQMSMLLATGDEIENIIAEKLDRQIARIEETRA